MKRNVMILILLCLLMMLVLPVCADVPHMADEAALLTDGEAAELEEKLSDLSDRFLVDIVIVTTDDLAGKTAMVYADDYYDYGGYRADGVLLLVSMEESDWWISTTGYGITAFTDAGVEYIGNQMKPYLSEGEFATAFSEFAGLCEEFLLQAKGGDPFDSHNLPKEPFRLGGSLIFALAVGLLVALVATGNMKSKLKTVKTQKKADSYVTPGSLQLTQSRDYFLYTHLDKREKTQSGSGSSTHTSSSGATHGGGGGKF